MYSDVFVPSVDIAETSVKHYKDRYSQLEKDYKSRRYNRDPLFTAEFLAADCTKVLNYVDLKFCIWRVKVHRSIFDEVYLMGGVTEAFAPAQVGFSNSSPPYHKFVPPH